jgi:DNA transposition AAA+ family ATPase
MQAQAQGFRDGGLGARVTSVLAQAEAKGDRRVTITSIAIAAGMRREMLSAIRNGRADATPEQRYKVLQVLADMGYADSDEAAEAQREALPAPIIRHTAGRVPLLETEAFSHALGWCNSIRQRREIGVMIGRPGIGKTTTLREYADKTPGVYMITCWRVMRMGDLLSEMARAVHMSLHGNMYERTLQLMDALSRHDDVMYILDEANQLKKWDTDKFEEIRQIWDATRTPVVLAGTYRLEEVLRRWDGRDETTQLSSRMSPYEYRGISEKEVRAILREYDLTADALAELTKIAMDRNNGGMRNLVAILGMCIEVAAEDRIDLDMVKSAARHKLPI